MHLSSLLVRVQPSVQPLLLGTLSVTVMTCTGQGATEGLILNLTSDVERELVMGLRIMAQVIPRMVVVRAG